MTEPLDPARQELKRFGARLKDRRILAALSRRAVAEKTLLSEATIKFIESARTRPKLATLVTLMRIPELDLQIDDLPSMSRKRVCELLALPRGSACTSQPAPSGPRPCSVTAEHCR